MEKGCIVSGLSTPGPRVPCLGVGGGVRREQSILGPFGGAEMIGQYKVIRYLKIKTEKECPHPAPPPKPKQVCFETLNMSNIKIVAFFSF